ncbi:MAG TPA: hypothetical protein VMR41_00875 [Patescibacteria group bacterium]|nr:hypothetical protein [Patescibacteria group bacterium]
MDPTQQPIQPAPVDTQSTKICPVCQYVVEDSWYFCPNCSKKLKMKPLPTTVWRQIGVYLLSVCLPPLGLFPAFNYLRQHSWKARIVGLMCILFTILSIVLTTWYAMNLMQQINTEMKSQLAPLQQLELQ